jgi:hypothetical protein
MFHKKYAIAMSFDIFSAQTSFLGCTIRDLRHPWRQAMKKLASNNSLYLKQHSARSTAYKTIIPQDVL